MTDRSEGIYTHIAEVSLALSCLLFSSLLSPLCSVSILSSLFLVFLSLSFLPFLLPSYPLPVSLGHNNTATFLGLFSGPEASISLFTGESQRAAPQIRSFR